MYKTYLQLVDFIDVTNWSVQYLKGTAFSYNKDFTLVEIGDFLTRNKTGIDIEDNIQYKRVTIKINNGGVFLRDIEIGKNIGTKKQFIVKKGQFLLSKIDARNGAFGVIPDEVDGAIITGNFWTFDVDYSKVNPYFLSLLVTTSEFLLFAENASNGATNRHYLQEDAFLKVKIPLPSLEVQNLIVEAYQENLKEAEIARQKAEELESNIEKYLMQELGIEIEEKSDKKGGLRFLDFEILQRWDVKFLLGSLPSIRSKYSIVVFSDIIKNLNKGPNLESIRINPFEYPQKEFRYIGMEHIEKETGKLLEMQEVEGKEIKSQTVNIPKGYIIFGKLRPYLNKYWINYTDYDNIICSSEFLVFDINEGINKEFFKYCLSSSFVQYQITDKTSGARMPRINEDIFMNLQVPLPPLAIQEKIVNHITEMKDEIDKLKKLAEGLREDAKVGFEKEIFS